MCVCVDVCARDRPVRHKTESTTTKEGDKIKARFVVEGKDVKSLTLHWGVAVKSDSEWITPQKVSVFSILFFLTLHWGVAIKFTASGSHPKSFHLLKVGMCYDRFRHTDFTQPWSEQANCEHIIPHNSILYKDRAIRTRLEKKGDDKLQVDHIVNHNMQAI